MRYNGPRMSSFTSIQTLIKDFSKGSALGLKLSEARLQQEWEALVGPTIAKHSYPESIRYSKLYLVADNSIWLQQLRFLKPTLLENIHSLLPELSLTDVILRIGSIPERTSAAVPSLRPVSQPSVLPSSFATGLAQRLSDPELQALLSQTITKSLSEPPPQLRDPTEPS